MKSIRTPRAMLLAGTLAGWLSGIQGPVIRAAAFGFTLSLTTILVKSKKWRWFCFLPGLLLGICLGFFKFNPFDGPSSSRYDGVTLLNCAIFIPAYVYAYTRPTFFAMLWRMALAGILSTLYRAASMETWSLFFLLFLKGTLPFLGLWLTVMWLTDPRFARTPKD